ncbi:MAG TPA: diadenylate cyclase CdaA [Thermoanaerobaculia bacterium]
MRFFDRLFSLQFTWRDAADILIVAIIIYWILSLMRGTRAMQVTIGLMLLGSTFFIARAFDLPALEVISREILFYLPFAIIILFQAEIRRALARMGVNPLAHLFGRRRSTIDYDAILDAVDVLSSRHIGALIVIEGDQTLRAYEEGSKPLDALLTAELLVIIFTPGGPLHDGAAIVRGDRIVVAGAFLPLTTSPDPKLAHGTRHRAAIGLTEDSDSLVIVVSEENGSIAVASDGTLRENLDRAAVLAAMVSRFGARS